jgi:SET domain-containing protein
MFNLLLQSFSIDANTCQLGTGHMVTDRKFRNCRMKKIIVNGMLHLCLFAVANIGVGDELTYDYGDKEERMFWRSKVCEACNLM